MFVFAQTVSPPTLGMVTPRKTEYFGTSGTKVTSVCHVFAFAPCAESNSKIELEFSFTGTVGCAYRFS